MFEDEERLYSTTSYTSTCTPLQPLSLYRVIVTGLAGGRRLRNYCVPVQTMRLLFWAHRLRDYYQVWPTKNRHKLTWDRRPSGAASDLRCVTYPPQDATLILEIRGHSAVMWTPSDRHSGICTWRQISCFQANFCTLPLFSGQRSCFILGCQMGSMLPIVPSWSCQTN